MALPLCCLLHPSASSLVSLRESCERAGSHEFVPVCHADLRFTLIYHREVCFCACFCAWRVNWGKPRQCCHRVRLFRWAYGITAEVMKTETPAALQHTSLFPVLLLTPSTHFTSRQMCTTLHTRPEGLRVQRVRVGALIGGWVGILNHEILSVFSFQIMHTRGKRGGSLRV